MAVPFSNTKLRVPRGFQNLLEGLAREVLRNQPDNIYAFAAIYFDNLLKMREQQGIDPAELGARHEDRYYNNKAFQNGNVGDVSDPQQQEAAVKIQSAVRGHQSRESSRPDPEAAKPSQEEAAVTIQAAYRGYEARKRVHALKEGEAEPATEGGTQEPAATAPEQPQEEEVDIDLDDPEVEKAAIKIQSSFKGFKTRKEMSAKKSDSSPTAEATETAEPSQEAADDAEPPKPAEETSQAEQPPADASTTEAPAAPAEAPAEEEVDIDLEDPEVEKAAIKIQAGFKGMMVRKGKKEGAKEEEAPTEEAAQAAEGDTKAEEPAAEASGDAEAPAAEEGKKEEEEEVDIDLSDPQVQDAAVKIQAGFKGMMVRKQMKEGKSEEGSEETPAEGDALQEEVTEPATTEDAPQEGEAAPAAEGEAPADADAGQAEEAPKAEGDAPEAEASQQEEAATQGEAAPTEGEAPAEDAPQAEQETPKEEETAPAEGEAAPAEETEQAEAPAEPTSTASTQDKDPTPFPSQVTSQGDNTAAIENVVEQDIDIEAHSVPAEDTTEESKDGEIQVAGTMQEEHRVNQIAVTEGLAEEQGGKGTSPEAGSEDRAAKDQNARSSNQSVVEEPDTKETADVADVAKTEEGIETENVNGVDQAAKDESTRSSKQSMAAESEAKEPGETEETTQAEKDIEIAGKIDEEQEKQAHIEKEAENVTKVNIAEQLKDGQEVDGNTKMPESGDLGEPDNEVQAQSEAAAEVPMASQEEQDGLQDKQTAVSEITHGSDESNTIQVPSEDKKEEENKTVPSQEESDPAEDKNEEFKESAKMKQEQIDSPVSTDEAKQPDKKGGISDTLVAIAEETATAEEVLSLNEAQNVEQEGMFPDETQSQIAVVQEASESDLEVKEEVTIAIEQSQDELLSGDAKKDMVDDNEGRDSGLGFEMDSPKLPESTVQASEDDQTDQDDKPETPDDLGNKEEQGTISQGYQSESAEENQPDDKPNQDENEQSLDATVEETQNANDVEGQEMQAQEAKAEEEASKAAGPSTAVDDQGRETSNVHAIQGDQSRGEENATPDEDPRDGGGEQERGGEEEGKELA